MKLREIAHARSGDKGDILNISVIANKPEFYQKLVDNVTSDIVRVWFRDFAQGDVKRYELPNLGALNFVIKRTGGGVTRSLALDAHGKTLSSALLEMEIPLGDSK